MKKIILIIIGMLFTCVTFAQLSGDYSIGNNGNFKSFTHAINTLNKYGVSGPVRFFVVPGVYKEHLVLSSGIKGLSSKNSIVFDGFDSSKVVLKTYDNVASPIIVFAGADHITFRNITFQKTRGITINFRNQADSNTIENCLFESPVNNTSVLSILFSDIDSLVYYKSKYNGSYNSFIGNVFLNGGNGIYIISDISSTVDNGFQTIKFNQFLNLYSEGITLSQVGHCLIEGNVFKVEKARLSTGIFASGGGGHKILSNYIRWGRYGIKLNSQNSIGNSYYSDKKTIVANNMVTGFYGTYVQYGLYIEKCYNLSVIHNTFRNHNNWSKMDNACIYAKYDLYNSEIKNNILSQGHYSNGYCLAIESNIYNLDMDYNVFHYNYTGSTSGRFYVEKLYYHWGNYKNNHIYDQHSSAIDTLILSDVDLHVYPQHAHRIARPYIAPYTYDIDSDKRDTIYAPAGADIYDSVVMACPGSEIKLYAKNIKAYTVIQWFKNGKYISGGKDTFLTIKNIGTKDTGLYRARVINGSNPSYYKPYHHVKLHQVSPVTAANDTSICKGDKVTLWAQGFGDLSWNINDTFLNLFYLPDTSHVVDVYPESTSTFMATFIDTNGCARSDSTIVTVMPSPDASFQVNDIDQCIVSNRFQSSYASNIPNDTVYCSWNMGDGTIYHQYQMEHSYTKADTFDLKLVLETGFGCIDSTTKPVAVYDVPVSSFETPDTAKCLYKPVEFLNKSIYVDEIEMKWIWDDGDTTHNDTTWHKFAYPGQYNVKLILYADSLCSDTMSKSVVVLNGIKADFVLNDPSQCLKGNSFRFSDRSSSSLGNYDLDWHIGDGHVYHSKDFTYVYQKADTNISVKMIAATLDGCKDSMIKKIHVNPNPVAGIKLKDSVQCFRGNLFELSDSGTIQFGTYASTWYWGDGTTSTGKTVQHFYAIDDTSFKVLLVAISDSNCVDTDSQMVKINKSPDTTLILNTLQQCRENNLFRFECKEQNVNWLLDNAMFSSNIFDSVSFADTGVFQLKMIVRNQFCKDSNQALLVVHKHPEDSFAYILENNGKITFDALEPGPATYLWYFGDGDSSDIKSPEHIYDSNATYWVELFIINQFNCAAYYSDSIILNTVSVPELNGFGDVSIYPNPSNDKIWLQFDEEAFNINIQLYNAQGQLITEKYFTGIKSEFIDLPESSGVYWLKVVDETNKARKVAIIQRL